jgi:hypothetical protein
MDIKRYCISLVGSGDKETALFTVSTENNLCRLNCEYRGKVIFAKARDFFEALCIIRLTLEKENLIPFCYGASLNVFPSPMAREMGLGHSAYRMEMGRSAKKENLVPIFSQGEDIVPASVERQRAYFEAWVASLHS